MASRFIQHAIQIKRSSPTLINHVQARFSSGASTPAKDSVIVELSAEEKAKDVVTHTGQAFKDADFRLARFVGRDKQVNPNWAIKLIDEIPPIPVQARTAHCDGGDGPLGHPRVFINLDQPGNHACMYCGLRFFQDTKHKH